MARWVTVAAALVLALAFAAGPVLAQEVPEKPWAVKVGWFRADSSAVRDALDDWLVGVDYAFNVTPGGAQYVGTVEYMPGNAKIWSLQALYRTMPSLAEEVSNRLSYGIGLGIYHVSNSKSATRLGVPIVVDLDLTSSLFAELKYNLVFGKVEHERINGLSLALGYRF